ncbi:MAG: ester cyclase [Acaryochloris sp. RU_4_1]|nr:ester cyclase [Leptolyngbyaceae cyanobacterium SU_3_3]NJM67036.1 ester cyclase [Acaryochloris sp. RU_4_1]NJR55988.1 ester cyclase [Acaryochloris sp. CRU_2_0]
MDAREIVETFVEKLWNQRQLDLADDLFPKGFAAEPIAHQPIWQGTGPDSMKHHIQEWVNGVPDLQMKIIASIAQDPQIWVRWEMIGTHRGVLYGIPPTGHTIRALGVTLLTIEQGQIRRLQTIFDGLGLMQQLDVLPDAGTLIQNHLSHISS